MKSHKFNKLEVLMLEPCIGERYKRAMWEKFLDLCFDFNFKIKPVKGYLVTHKLIGGDDDDFKTICELTKGV